MGGAFTFVLHSHLPFVRGAGRWPHGEEWIHEAILGTYLPLLVALHDLRESGLRFRLVLGLTPILLEQLADPDIDRRFVEYADLQVGRAHADANRLAEEGHAQRALVACHYRERYRALRDAYLHRFGRDLCGAFAALARSGELEILTSAATHGYLPLLDDASIEAQLAIGRSSTKQRLGLEPAGIWLPECAYRPGLETALERHGLTHFFIDRHLLGDRATARANARVVTAPAARLSAARDPDAVRSGGASEAGRPAGPSRPEPGDPSGARDRDAERSGAARKADADRSGGALARIEPEPVPAAGGLRPYLVGGSRVAAIARHDAISGQVWASSYGYPGDAAYREFHKKDARTGLRYWRVTGSGVPLDGKAEYVLEDARARAALHAADFVAAVRGALERTPADALLVAAFDSELFGHWWYEGVDWLAAVLRGLVASHVPMATAAEHLAAHPPRERAVLAEGSWGKGNDHSTWENEGTAWMQDELAAMAAALAALRADPPDVPLRARAALQAVRELLLAQASDWPFLVTTGQAADYATERFRTHAMRFRRALDLARRGTPDDEPDLRGLERTDDPFPDASLAAFG